MKKCKYKLVNIDNKHKILNGGNDDSGLLFNPSNDFKYGLLYFNKSNKTDVGDLYSKYNEGQCSYDYKDIDKYAENIKNELFDMNKNLSKSFNVYDKKSLVEYSETSVELIKQIDGLKTDVYNFNLYKYCKDNTFNENERRTKFIAHEINIRRYIQIYINNNYEINVTRGFLKMYDILNRFDLIDLKAKQVNTFHACEAPGNFINATNHWIKSRNPDLIFNWTGNSVNPFHSNVKNKFGDVVGDDYGYIVKYKKRWDFGKDDYGDITNIENLLYWESKYDHSIDLMTSDCGYNKLDEDKDNNSMLVYLNLCQTILGLLIVKLGGNMICKIFLPFDNPMMISILFLFNIYYDNTHIIKQESGNLFSSEVYIVGINKTKHLDEITKKKLLDVIGKFDINKTLFKTFPEEYIEDLRLIASFFMNNITESLDKLLFYYRNNKIFQEHMLKYFKTAKYKCSKKWISDNDFKLIDKSLEL